MSKKISKEEFIKRFYKRYPKAKITILEYTATSKPARVRCNYCGKELYRPIARQFLNGFDCCHAHDETRLEKVKRMIEEKNEYIYIKQVDKDHIIVKHKPCGNEFKRALNACLDNPDACIYCQTYKTSQMMTIEEVQRTIDEVFDGDIKILDYKGQLERNHYRCMRCGKIFTRVQTTLLASRGCPSCNKRNSKGEKKMIKILNEARLSFKEQVILEGLPRLRFDFGVYNDENELLYLIEVQGKQHYKPVEFWGGEEGFKKQQERDKKKRKYCKENNIPLYEIDYDKELLNLDILPFSSTTIPAKGSTA